MSGFGPLGLTVLNEEGRPVSPSFPILMPILPLHPIFVNRHVNTYLEKKEFSVYEGEACTLYMMPV